MGGDGGEVGVGATSRPCGGDGWQGSTDLRAHLIESYHGETLRERRRAEESEQKRWDGGTGGIRVA